MTILSVHDVVLNNGNRVPGVLASADSSLEGLAENLHLTGYQGAIGISGGAAGLDRPEYTDIRHKLVFLLYELGHLACREKIILIDGGTASGGMRIIGQVRRSQGNVFPLVGVAPVGKVRWPNRLDLVGANSFRDNVMHWLGFTVDVPGKDIGELDNNHSAFVMADSEEWGGEVHVFSQAIYSLADSYVPIQLVINGGLVTRKDTLSFLQGNGQMIVVSQTGRFADKLTGAIQTGDFESNDAIEIRELRTIMENPNIHIMPLDSPKGTLTALIMRLRRQSV